MKFINNKNQFKTGYLYKGFDNERTALYYTTNTHLLGINENSWNDEVDRLEMTWVSSCKETDTSFSSDNAAFYELGPLSNFPEYLI